MRAAVTILTAAMLLGSCGTDDVPEAADDRTATSTTAPTAIEAPQTTASVESGTEQLSATDQEEIFAAAVLHRVAEANSYGGVDIFGRVEVVDRLGALVGESGDLADDERGTPLTTAERAAITAALAPRVVVFVPPGHVSTSEDANRLAERDSAIVTLSAPILADGRVEITTSMTCGSLCGIGGLNVVERDDRDRWSIGRPVIEWIA